MVMSAYVKTLFRSFKNHIGRFISISVIILLGIAFVAGLGILSPQIKESVDQYLKEHNAADIIIKNTSAAGFSDSEIDTLKQNPNIEDIQPFTAMDMPIEDANARIYAMPLSNMTVNPITLTEGKWPENGDEALLDRASHGEKTPTIGGVVNVFGTDKTIVGFASNPLHFSKDGEPDLVNQEPLELIVYLNSVYVQMPLPLTDSYIKTNRIEQQSIFSDKYKDAVNLIVTDLKSTNDEYVYLTLQDNKSCVSLESYCDKILIISIIFSVFFIAVAALVVLTTMTRLIEEERAMIGCYKTLGYGNGKIIFKYLFSAFICCIAASAIGLILGIIILPAVIYPAFGGLYFMPAMAKIFDILFGLIAAAAMLAAVLGVTFYVAKKDLNGEPAIILRPKSPKAGKKIFLEKIPFLWKRLSFKYKSTFRNIFRNIKHLLMTVISIAGSSALILAGFALLDIANKPINGLAANFKNLFTPISFVIIIFAVLLCAFVVYNLTNMNISERKREIATLKVLGYHDTEALGYIYREIFIMALFGVFVGIPLGVGLIAFVFNFLNFGSITNINWYSYILSGVIVLFFVAIVDLLLNRKIKAIDMAASLKSVD